MKKLLLHLGIVDRKTFFAFAAQFFKFGIVGLSNTLIALAVYYVLTYLGLNYLVSYFISFVASVLNAYYWNNRYVFKKTSNGNLLPFTKVFLAYGAVFLLSLFTLFVMVSHLNVSERLAPVLNLFITIPLNFLLNKFWAFK